MRRSRSLTTCLMALVALALVPGVAAAAPRTIVDDDFAAGTPDASTVVTGGSVQLSPTVPIDQPSFSALPAG